MILIQNKKKIVLNIDLESSFFYTDSALKSIVKRQESCFTTHSKSTYLTPKKYSYIHCKFPLGNNFIEDTEKQIGQSLIKFIIFISKL